MSNDEEPERRPAPRKQLVRAAIVSFEGPTSPIPCVLLDVSASGVRVNVHRPDDVPDRFLLRVETEGMERTCQVAWRRGEEIGASFID